MHVPGVLLSGACRVAAFRARGARLVPRAGGGTMTPTETAPWAIQAAGRTAAASPLRYPGGKAALAGFFGGLIVRLGIPARYVCRALCGRRGGRDSATTSRHSATIW